MKLGVRLLAFSAVLLATPVAAQINYSGLYVFGDSLVDPGNAHLATSGAEAPAADGYYFGRFSNGPNFADYLGQALVGDPATPVLLGGTNVAVGGATAGYDRNETSPSFPQQTVLYSQLVGRPIPSDALVLVAFGGNDVRNTVGIGGEVDFTAATAGLRFGLDQLYAGGARNFLITGSGDIGLLPRSAEQAGVSPGRLDELTFRSEQISTLFQNTSNAFAGLTGANVTYFDLFGFEHALRANPAILGLPASFNTTEPCQNHGAGVPQLANCANSLYFDAIHPTTIAHQAVASAMLSQLSDGTGAVPEPGTWMMMILGFGFLGAKLRTVRHRAGGRAARAMLAG